jgi:TP901 family phage tail tape measure protein
MASTRLNIIVSLQDAASANVRKVKGEIKGIGSSAQKAASGGLRALGRQLLFLGTTYLGIRAVADSIRTFAEFDDVMRQVGAVTGATAGQLQKMTDTALELGKTTRFTSSQAAEGFRLLGMAGFEAEEAISALPGVLNLAAAGSIDLGTAADIATNVLSGFGLEVEHLGQVNDVLVKTFTSSNTTLSELGEGFKLVGPIAKGLGANFEDLFASLGRLGDAGLKGTLAGTALRGALNALFNPTNQERELMEQLAARIGQTSLEIKDANGNFVGFAKVIEQLERAGLRGEEALALFGQRAGPGMAALLEVGSEELEKFKNQLDAAGGTADRIAKQMEEGIGGAIREVKSALEGVKIIFVSIFGEDLIALIRNTRDSLRDLADWIYNNQDALEELASVAKTTFEVLAKSAYAAGSLFGVLTGNIDLAKYSFEKLTGTTKEFSRIQRIIIERDGKKYEVTLDKITRKVLRYKEVVDETAKGPIGTGPQKEKTFIDKIADQLKLTPSAEAAAKASFLEIDALLKQESETLEGRYDQQKISLNEYFSERAAIVKRRVDEEIKILQASLDKASEEEGNQDQITILNAQIAAKRTNLNTELLKLENERVKEEKKINDEKLRDQEKLDAALLKAKEKTNDLAIKAEQVKADQIQRIRTLESSNSLAAQFQGELIALNERHQKELEVIQDFNKTKLDLLRQQKASESEINRQAAENEQAIKEQQALQDQERFKLVANQLARQKEEELSNLSNLAGGASSLFADLYDLTGKKNKELFIASKAAALAESFINTSLAVTKALTDPGGYAGIALAAVIAAKGAVESSKIASQGFAGGGQIPGVSPSPTADDKKINITSGEYVEPNDAIKYFGKGGLNFLEAFRRKSLPKDIFSGFKSSPIRYGRAAFAAGGAVSSNSGESAAPGFTIINVTDESMLDSYLAGKKAERRILNIVRKNKATLKE